MSSLLFALALPAAAQTVPLTGGVTPDVNAQFFRPAMDSATTWWTTTSYTPSSFRPGGQALVHYTDQPFVYRDGQGETVNLVGGIAQLDLVGWLGGDRWRVGVDAPVYLYSWSDVDDGQAGLGDLALEGKVVAVDAPDVVNVALTGRVDLPTATVQSALGGGRAGWELAAVLDHAFGDLLVATNVGVRGAPEASLENVELNDYLVLRGGAAYTVSDGAGVSLEAMAQPALSAELTNPAAVPAEWMAGAWFPLLPGLSGRAGFGTGLTSGIGAPDWRLVFGVSAAAEDEPLDYDGDGIVDQADPCMTEPEDVDGVRDDDGCPDLPPVLLVRVVDDGGNVLDSAITELVSASGAAVPVSADELRHIDPGAWTVRASAPGHEPGTLGFEVAPDAEGNITVLVRLEAVKLATLHVRVVGPDGQPLAGGRIGTRGQELGDAPGWDGTLAPGDATIRARVPGYKPAEQAVVLVAGETTEVLLRLEPAKAEFTNNRIELKESVFFDTGKATIQERSFALLDEVAKILGEYPQIALLRVEGHTDSRGSATANLTLSKKRAAAVKDWLVAHGVAAERLTSEGYGETKPLDPREVTEAWEKNRRVDLLVEKWVDLPAAPTP